MAQLVFDGIVPSTALYTRPFPVPTNGQYLTLQVIGIPVTGTGTLTAQLETSQDGQSWVNVNATAEIDAASLTARQETPIYGSSTLTRIQGSVGRLRIVMNTAGDLAHVRVYAGVRGKRTARMFGFAVAEGCGCESGGASPGRTRAPGSEVLLRPPPTGGPPSPWPKKAPPPNSQPMPRGAHKAEGSGHNGGISTAIAPYQGWGYPGGGSGGNGSSGGGNPPPSDTCTWDCSNPPGFQTCCAEWWNPMYADCSTSQGKTQINKCNQVIAEAKQSYCTMCLSGQAQQDCLNAGPYLGPCP